MKTTAAILISLGIAGVVFAGKDAAPGKASTNSTSATKAAAPTQSPAAAGVTRKGDSLTVIGYLEKRDRVITIKSGPKGPVYSVATKDGKTLFENLTAEQLRAQAPELHDLIKTGVAGDARVRISAILDATR